MKTFTRVSVLLILLGWPAFAQGNDLGVVAFHQALLDMRTDLRLMCVAAHPDDEDGATLAYYRMHDGVKTYTVVATRGEGGQNEIGPELYNDLGVIRTREMSAAAEVTGAELHFLNLPEFGFSKSSEEAFSVWGRDETVKRLVRVIRETKPDVIITNHDTTHGHGHHQAVGIALIQAFHDAGDPNKYPEQIAEGLQPWQPQRLFVRTEEDKPESITVPIYAFDSWRGKTYAEVAADALRRHRSQGMQFFIDRYLDRTITAKYELVDGTKPPAPGEGSAHPGLLSGLNDRIIPDDANFTSAASLDDVRRDLPLYAAQLKGNPDASPEAQNRIKRANDATVKAAELRLNVAASDAELVPGQTVVLHASIDDFGVRDALQATLTVKSAPWFPIEEPAPDIIKFENGKAPSIDIKLRIPDDAEPTLPAAEHLFLPHFLEPQLTVSATVICGPAWLQIDAPLHIDIARPVSVHFAEENYLARVGGDASVPLELVFEDHAPGPAEAKVKLSAPPALRLSTTDLQVPLQREGEQKVVSIAATWAEDATPGEYEVQVIGEDGKPLASTKVCRVKVAIPDPVNVGVVQSYDDTLVKTLERLGVPHAALTEEDFAPERLDRFTAILVDIRAYLVRPDLVANNAALLEYVHRGGKLVVMYQKTFEWKPEYAPYPLHISTNRVTREDAPVTFLRPEHAFFSTPNSILPTDWDGWIQERGLYFADQWDPHYTPLIHTVDPGENIPDGSYLVASYGKGTYVYTALVWYRQLRALNPGTLRLFANLIAK
jgi:LmbE family N-acetylglucosaminyl deacetylase